MTEQVVSYQYKCTVCGELFSSDERAVRCESRPVTHDKGAKVGDSVLILNGDGKGERATVEEISVINSSWGHRYWERYWHTVGVLVGLKWGHRFLTFDDYEVLT